MLLEAGRCNRGEFGNPEEGERPPLQAISNGSEDMTVDTTV
jgi:hypothetical protein